MKKSNTTVTEQGIEVYENDIYRLVDEYINTVLQVTPEEFDTQKEYKAVVADSFVDMIFYIADRIPKPSNDDIELLDNIFNIFVRVCSKYNVLPTLEVFSFLVNINRSTFSDWMRGDYRTSSSHGTTVKKWFDICKNCTVNRLNNQPGTNANLIFVAKAAYGMAETAPVQIEQQQDKPRESLEQIKEEFGGLLTGE
nr:MAG TPA: bacterial regulatory protein [Caudoviricetes sp.]